MPTDFEDMLVGARPVGVHVVGMFITNILPFLLLPIPISFAVSYFMVGISNSATMFLIALLNLMLAATAWGAMGMLAFWIVKHEFLLWNNRFGQVKLLDLVISGTIWPVAFMPRYISWVRYASPTW